MAQTEDLIVDQGTSTLIKLECYNPDGTEKQFNEISIADGTIIPKVDVYGYIKKSFSSPDSDRVEFETTTINPENMMNIITLYLTAEQTDAMKAGNYVYDVEIEQWDSLSQSTIVERILQGKLTVTPSVTR